MPLTSTGVPVGRPVTVQVSISFSERDLYSGEETRYRLIRTCQETRGVGDEYQRTDARVRLLQQTDQGDDYVDFEEGLQARISAMLPLSLADVFFTDGDAVQNFVSGVDQSEKDRQEYVHKAIRQLLGFDDVESAQRVLGTVSRRFRRNLLDSGSQELQAAEESLEKVERELGSKQNGRILVRARIEGVEQQIREDERELDRIRGVGNLDAIQSRIRQLSADIEHLEIEEQNVRKQMKDVLQSEGLSTRMLGDRLQSGVGVLAELEDRNVIPGISVGLLHDRLELGECICGAKLSEGNDGHTHIVELIDHQRRAEPRLQRLTELRYESRTIAKVDTGEPGTNGRFTDDLRALREQFTDCKDRQRQKAGDLRAEEERRLR